MLVSCTIYTSYFTTVYLGLQIFAESWISDPKSIAFDSCNAPFLRFSAYFEANSYYGHTLLIFKYTLEYLIDIGYGIIVFGGNLSSNWDM